MAEISIIVPIYNAENYLFQCLESLSDQLFKDIEIICVDDSSTDSSSTILAKAASRDKRIKIYTQSENRGVEIARHKGLLEARGKYIMFCDADDWYEPEMCQEMYNVMELGGVDLAICKTSVFKEGDKEHLYNYSYFDFAIGGIENINIALINNINTVLWNKIFRRDIIEKHNITFPEFKDIRLGWDEFFVLEYMLVSKKIFFLDKVLHNYRVRNDSLTGDMYCKVSKNYEDVWNGLEKFYNILFSKSLLNDEVMEFFLSKYSYKTKHYFDFLPSLEDRIKALNDTREFLENVAKTQASALEFKDKYLRSLLMMTYDYMMRNKSVVSEGEDKEEKEV